MALKALNVKGNPIAKHPKCNFQYLQSLFFNLTELNDEVFIKKKISKSLQQDNSTNKNTTASQLKNESTLQLQLYKPRCFQSQINLQNFKDEIVTTRTEFYLGSQFGEENDPGLTQTLKLGKSMSRSFFQPATERNFYCKQEATGKENQLNLQVNSTSQSQVLPDNISCVYQGAKDSNQMGNNYSDNKLKISIYNRYPSQESQSAIQTTRQNRYYNSQSIYLNNNEEQGNFPQASCVLNNLNLDEQLNRQNNQITAKFAQQSKMQELNNKFFTCASNCNRQKNRYTTNTSLNLNQSINNNNNERRSFGYNNPDNNNRDNGNGNNGNSSNCNNNANNSNNNTNNINCSTNLHHHSDSLISNNPLDTQGNAEMSFDVKQNRKDLSNLNLSRISHNFNQKSLVNISIPQLPLDTVFDNEHNNSHDIMSASYLNNNNRSMITIQTDKDFVYLKNNIKKITSFHHKLNLKWKAFKGLKILIAKNKNPDQQPTMQSQKPSLQRLFHKKLQRTQKNIVTEVNEIQEQDMFSLSQLQQSEAQEKVKVEQNCDGKSKEGITEEQEQCQYKVELEKTQQKQIEYDQKLLLQQNIVDDVGNEQVDGIKEKNQGKKLQIQVSTISDPEEVENSPSNKVKFETGTNDYTWDLQKENIYHSQANNLQNIKEQNQAVLTLNNQNKEQVIPNTAREYYGQSLSDSTSFSQDKQPKTQRNLDEMPIQIEQVYFKKQSKSLNLPFSSNQSIKTKESTNK